MTPPLSIFSFSTLRVRPWLPKSLLLAVVILIAAEAGARRMVATHRLDLDPTARRLIDDHRAILAKKKPAVWLFGNSTLDWGVDEKILARTKLDFVKLPHGSATVAASAMMLESYLSIAPKPPAEIVLFISEDDLNLNGSRAEVSKEYTTLFTQKFRSPQEFLTLWQARAHILARLQSDLERFIPGGAVEPASSSKSDPPFDGIITPDDEHYLILIKHFSLDRQAIGAFAAVAHRHGIANVKIVLVPCTDVYARFHDAKIPDETYDQMRQEIRQMCNAASIQFLDFGDPLTNYSEFHDGYHLNSRGAVRFTNELIARHVF